METQLLRDPNILPTKEVLENVLAGIYSAYEVLMNIVTNPDHALTYEWRYYKDGKSWLCKVCYKKKTVFWLSVWEGYFQIGFFFTEKHLKRIEALDIDKKIKEEFYQTKNVGKLLPMIFKISEKEQLADLLKVVEFKKKLK